MYNLELPPSYLSISTAIYKNAKIEEIFNSHEFDGSLGKLKLVVRYKDIGGSEIEKSFRFDVKFFVKSIKSNSVISVSGV